MTARLRRTGATRAFLLAVGVVAALVALGLAPADAEPRQATPTTTVPPDPNALPAPEPPDPVLDLVEVHESGATVRSGKKLEEATFAEQTATAVWLTAEALRQGAAGKRDETVLAEVAAQGRKDEAEREVDRRAQTYAQLQAVTDQKRAVLAGEQRRLRTIAAAVFTSAPADGLAGLANFDEMSVGLHRDAIRGRVVELQTKVVDARSATWREARSISRAAGRRLRAAEGARDDRADELAAATAARQKADDFLFASVGNTADKRTLLDRAMERRTEVRDDHRHDRLTDRVVGTDMTLVDVNAYWNASRLAPCHLPWWVIAGVGEVESRHGTAQGSEVTAEGDTTRRILGIPLDGRPGTAAIRDSDGGRLDGDGTWDRAVGPMQFLPGTWGVLGIDADEDGIVDPHNLNDAAGAAGQLLCLGRGDLTTDAQYRGALLAYNNSIPYGNQVLGVGHHYQETLDLPDVPPEDLELLAEPPG